MARRPAKAQRETMPETHVGEIDPPSKAAAEARIELCVRLDPDEARRCTRASGHREAGVDHPAHAHVHAPRPNFIAKVIW